jgi:hypothetical protein
VAAVGSATADRTCIACDDDTFSTTENASECGPWSDCLPGQHIVVAGSATADRACAACADGTFSGSENAVSCTPWRTCGVVGVIEAGTDTSDVLCGWLRQFGTTNADHARAVIVDGAGNVLVTGNAAELPGQTVAGPFVRKYDSFGVELWTRQFGTSEGDLARAISVDGDDNVLVAGYTGGLLPGQSPPPPQEFTYDAFVRKYDASGSELWTRQFSGPAGDSTTASAVTVDGDGNVLVVGSLAGALPGQTWAGNADAFVRKYDAAGAEIWTRQFGTSEDDGAGAVGVSADGTIVVVGATEALLPGQTGAPAKDVPDAFVRKYDASGNELWTRQFGTSEDDWASGVSVDALGSVVVSGTTYGVFSGQTGSGGYVDAFVRKYDASGNELWMWQFGSGDLAYARSVTVDNLGDVIVAGEVSGTLPGQTSSGGSDVFMRKYDASGIELWTRQFGSSANDDPDGISVDSDGNIAVSGGTWGSLPGYTNAGFDDAFVMKLGD